MEWNKQEVESFLGVLAVDENNGYIFRLPFPGGEIDVCVFPQEDRVQIYDRKYLSQNSTRAPMSAYVHCVKITVDNEPTDEGGNCVVLSGRGGHACISPENSYFAFFFSMYGE